MIFLLLLISISCKPIDCCGDVENFIDRWWEVETTIDYNLNCYLFSSDGNIIEGNDSNVWIAGTWTLVENTDHCIHEIESNDHILELIEYDEECWLGKYDERDISICECQLF